MRALALLLCAGCGLANGLEGPKPKFWREPVQLDQGVSAHSDAPHMVFAQGKAWATYQSWDAAAGMSSVWVTNHALGSGSWATPQQIPQIPGYQQGLEYPQIAVGGAGDPVIALIGITSNPQTYSIWAGRLHGLTIPLAELVRIDAQTGNAFLSQQRSIAADADGNAVLAWFEAGNLYARTLTGTTWSPSATVTNSTSAQQATPALAVGATGKALVSWMDSADRVSPLAYASSGVSAGASAALPSQDSPMYIPAVAMRGNVGFVASGGSGSLGVVRVENGVAAAPVTVAASGASYYGDPAIATNAQGKAVVVWRDSSTSTGDAYTGILKAATYDGAQWSAPQTISLPGGTRKAWWTAVDMNDAGTAIAAWADFDETMTYTRIWMAMFHDGVWDAPKGIDTPAPGAYLAGVPENVRYISVAMDPAGTAACVSWIMHPSQQDTHTFASCFE